MFPLRQNEMTPTLTTLIQHCTGSLIKYRVAQGNQGIYIGKEEIKLYLHEDNMTLHTENFLNLYRHYRKYASLLEKLLNKGHTQKSTVDCICTSTHHQQLVKKIKTFREMPSKVTSNYQVYIK